MILTKPITLSEFKKAKKVSITWEIPANYIEIIEYKYKDGSIMERKVWKRLSNGEILEDEGWHKVLKARGFITWLNNVIKAKDSVVKIYPNIEDKAW